MTKRLTLPQKPSEQLASAPIVNPVASAITAVSFRAIAGRWLRHDGGHDAAAVVGIAVYRPASRDKPLAAAAVASQHQSTLRPLSPAVLRRAFPRPGGSGSLTQSRKAKPTVGGPYAPCYSRPIQERLAGPIEFSGATAGRASWLLARKTEENTFK